MWFISRPSLPDMSKSQFAPFYPLREMAQLQYDTKVALEAATIQMKQKAVDEWLRKRGRI